MEGKGRGKGPSPLPNSCPPDQDIFGGQKVHSCNAHNLRIMAGHFLELQVAGRPPLMAGRPRVKRVNEN